jgi:pimeloyl-ACP methyl ester carboxylesterase
MLKIGYMKTLVKFTALLISGALVLTGCSTLGGNPDDAPLSPAVDFSDIPFPTVLEIDNINPKPEVNWTTLEEYYEQEFSWSDCQDPKYKCSLILVPKNWDKPGEGLVSIAMFMLPSTSPNPKGSILVNPGGPGASGIDLVYFSGEYIATSRLRDNYNIVGFDPRGVGFSDSVYCGTEDYLDYAFLEPEVIEEYGSPTELALGEELVKRLSNACAEGTGDLLAYVDTISSARDMDIIRDALGDDLLNYIGFSYGTQLGAVYAALYPERVGRLLLDGAINPTQSMEEGSIGQAGGFERAFSNYVEDCISSDTCPGDSKDKAGVLLDVKNFLLGLEKKPIPTNMDMELGINGGIVGIIANLYSKRSWATLSSALSSGFEGNGEELLRSSYRYYDRSEDGTYLKNATVANIAINCADGRYSTNPEVIKATNDSVYAAAPLFGRYFANSYLSCSGWAHPPKDGTSLDYGVKLANTVLVIGTTGDPATPYQSAVELSELLNSARLITFEGEGHTVYANQSLCVDEIVDDYFVDGKIPDSNMVCSE